MELVFIVVLLALIQNIAFGILVGRARGKYNIQAPATSGHEVFDRFYRVHANTQEQLIVFIPTILIYGHLANPTVAAGLGVVYLISRLIYLRSYVADPGSRTIGFLGGFLPTAFMLIAALISAIGSQL